MSNGVAQIFIGVFRDIYRFAVGNVSYLLKNKSYYCGLNICNRNYSYVKKFQKKISKKNFQKKISKKNFQKIFPKKIFPKNLKLLV